VGQAAITDAGDLAVRWVIHAAAMGDEPVSERSIRDSTSHSLTLAAEHGATRIAFPVLGTGVGGFDFQRAAALMREAIEASDDTDAIEEIVFYGFLPEHAATLRRVLQ
jgi:O-acetyl-ADP-ribose deacetylase (regulator of RNase III)